jgi:glucuronoarabinoxylan endo-1,4-beta-xylanase
MKMKNQFSHQKAETDSKCFTLREILSITAMFLFLTPAGFAASGNVNFNTTYQQIEGFGAAMYDGADTLVNRSYKETFYDYAFRDLGLDIIRIRNSTTSSHLNNAAIIVGEAKERNPNIKILLTPWSPPGNLKSNSSPTGGGTLAKSGTVYYNDALQELEGFECTKS